MVSACVIVCLAARLVAVPLGSGPQGGRGAPPAACRCSLGSGGGGVLTAPVVLQARQAVRIGPAVVHPQPGTCRQVACIPSYWHGAGGCIDGVADVLSRAWLGCTTPWVLPEQG